MAWVAGIDEAGYGPLLGPLTIGASLWQTADGAIAETDFWKLLRHAVARPGGRKKQHWRIPVGDSKLVYDRAQGICSLERSVLAFARVAEQPHDSLESWLASLGADVGAQGRLIPWYALLDRKLPLD